MTSPRRRCILSRRCFAHQPRDLYSACWDKVLHVPLWILPHLHTKKVRANRKTKASTNTRASILFLVHVSWVHRASLYPFCIFSPRVAEGFYTLLFFCKSRLSNSITPLGPQIRKCGRNLTVVVRFLRKHRGNKNQFAVRRAEVFPTIKTGSHAPDIQSPQTLQKHD